MSKAIVRFLAILGALWLIGMVIVLVAVIGAKGRVPSKTILEANFEQTFLEDAPDTYYVTEYYRPHPVVLVRLSHLDRDALRDLLSVSWRMAVEKARGPTRRGGRSRAGRA